jgi:hypothetical protein
VKAGLHGRHFDSSYQHFAKGERNFGPVFSSAAASGETDDDGRGRR